MPQELIDGAPSDRTSQGPAINRTSGGQPSTEQPDPAIRGRWETMPERRGY